MSLTQLSVGIRGAVQQHAKFLVLYDDASMELYYHTA